MKYQTSLSHDSLNSSLLPHPFSHWSFTSLLHVPSVHTKLPPNGREDDSEEQDETACDQVGYGQEVVLTPKPADCGQDHFLSALEVLHWEVWRGGRGQG